MSTLTSNPLIQAVSIREMRIEDYPRVRALWESEPGIKISEVDTAEAVNRLLNRCPRISLVAELQDSIIGSVLGSEDTRRGYIHHLVVAPEWRRHGVGRRLMTEIGKRFLAAGIPKLHLFILSGNRSAASFYDHIGWHDRPDIILMSHSLNGTPATPEPQAAATDPCPSAEREAQMGDTRSLAR